MARYEQQDRAGALAELDRAQAAAEAAGEIHLRTRIALHRAQVLEEMDRPEEFADAARVGARAQPRGRGGGLPGGGGPGVRADRRRGGRGGGASPTRRSGRRRRRTCCRRGCCGAGRWSPTAGPARRSPTSWRWSPSAWNATTTRARRSCAGSWPTCTGRRGGSPRRPRSPRRRCCCWTGRAAQYEADQCRHLLSQIYLALDEEQPALTLLEQLAANFDSPDNLPDAGAGAGGGRGSALRPRS